MIEAWKQKGRKPSVFSSEALTYEIGNFFAESSDTSWEREATEGIFTFLIALQEIEGVEGVAFSLIREPHVVETLGSIVKAPFYDHTPSSNSRIFRAVVEANLELTMKLNPNMPSGLRFNKSTDLTPRSFVSALRRKCGGSKREELIGVFLFR